MKKLVSIIIACALLAMNATAQKYVTPKPLSKTVTTTLKPVRSATTLPTITWGGDIATVYGIQAGIFKNNGLSLTLKNEDNFAAQVQRCLDGETPYIRGTMGMINAAADAFKAAGGELIVFYQLTWSNGGDAAVFRSGKNIQNAKNVALQLYGPHMDYAANLFSSAGRLGQVTFKWLEELTLNDRGTDNNPVDAFTKDATLDAAFCIIPDALVLTSDGTVGTGSEGSVKGAKIGLTTKSANRIICDVYAVRKDYYDAHKDEVLKLTKALMQSQEGLQDLIKEKASRSGEYKQVIAEASSLFWGTATATDLTEPLLLDCEFVGHAGNAAFFTGQGTTRNFKTLNGEIQKSFTGMGLMTAAVNIGNAGWDYNVLAQGLKNATTTAAATTTQPRFDTKKVTQVVENKIKAEADTWEESDVLFVVEIYFQPNQDEFAVADYAADFKEVLKLAQTYGGAIIALEGHSDKGGILKAKQEGKSPQEISQIEQETKNLSKRRAENVKKSFLAYCKQQGIAFDASQIAAIGRGADSPKFSAPKTRDEWAQNFRVVFRLKQLEAELDSFDPSIYK